MTLAVAPDGQAPRPASPAFWDGLRARLDGPGVLSAVLMALLVLAIVPPIVILLYRSFIDVDAAGTMTNFTIEHYRAIFSEEGFFAVARTSVIFASVTTLIALVLGGSVAWLV